MIEKLKITATDEIGCCNHYNFPFTWDIVEKVNELISEVNKLSTMAKNTNLVLKTLIEENNIHEEQIDKLQMKVEPEKVDKVFELTELLKDPRYWRDHDSDYVAKVEEQFKKYYGGNND